MSSQLQDEAHAIALEADRQRVQDELDALTALYDQPCCKVTAKICYLQGRLDRAQETLENEGKRIDKLIDGSATTQSMAPGAGGVLEG